MPKIYKIRRPLIKDMTRGARLWAHVRVNNEQTFTNVTIMHEPYDVFDELGRKKKYVDVTGQYRGRVLVQNLRIVE